jgi:hypothetical protein
MNGVKGLPQTHYMFPNMLKVANLVDAILEKHDLRNCIFAELYNNMNFEQTLTWRFGSPKTDLYVFTPNKMYLDKVNPFLHQWKECDIDHDVTKIFGTKYSQGSRIIDLPDKYNLFLLQDNIGPEYDHMLDAMKYAEEQKVYTVFKQHPLTEICIHNSDYIIFADANCNLDHLLDNADKVFSSWSSVSLNAMLKGKPCATYDTMAFSEIVPKIDSAYQLEDIEPVNQDDLSRFLSWFTHKLCIDVSKEGFEEKIEQRIVSFR